MKVSLSPDITVKTKKGPRIEIFLCHVKQIDSRTLRAIIHICTEAAKTNFKNYRSPYAWKRKV